MEKALYILLKIYNKKLNQIQEVDFKVYKKIYAYLRKGHNNAQIIKQGDEKLVY